MFKHVQTGKTALFVDSHQSYQENSDGLVAFLENCRCVVLPSVTRRLTAAVVGRRDWYRNASCRTSFRRRALATAFTHPSCMVYPPGLAYTPPASPEPTHRVKWQGPKLQRPESPDHEEIDTEFGIIASESQ